MKNESSEYSDWKAFLRADEPKEALTCPKGHSWRARPGKGHWNWCSWCKRGYSAWDLLHE